MKITSVEPFHISVPYDYGGPLQKADSIPWRNMETLLVKVTTDAGVTGWGEGFGFTICGTTGYAVTHAIAPLAVGRDPRDIAALVNDIARKQHNCSRNGPVAFALSALDIALWDIAGKLAGQPLYRLLGGAETVERMPAYASLLRYGKAELVERKSAEAVEQGYSRVKLHEIGTAEVAVARKAMGPGIKLMVDTNCPWTADQAIAMAKEFAPHDLLWIEEPVWPPEDYAAMARVRRDGGVAVAAGENGGTFADFVQLIETAHVDYVQPDVAGRRTGSLARHDGGAAFALFRAWADRHHAPRRKHARGPSDRALLPRTGGKPVGRLDQCQRWPHAHTARARPRRRHR